MSTYKTIVISWVSLLILTLFSVGVGKYFHENLFSKGIFIIVVMLIVFLKGQQIVDVFMELKHAPNRWRYLLLSYVIIVPSVIALIYL